ncbi:hypothetical protein Tco_0415900 [Tanacetum coccineum]
MSNSNINLQTQSLNALHNAIMEAGSKDHTPMLAPEWQRFVTLVKQSEELKIISYHKLYDILKQQQHEVNEIRAERLAFVQENLHTYHNNLRDFIQTLSRANQDNSPKINRGTGYDNQRAVNIVGARENVEEAGVQLNAEQADWKDDTDDEFDDQELEAHYMNMST